MSLQKRRIESHFQKERAQAIEALEEVRRASRTLNNVEDVSALDMSALDDVCRSLHHTQRILENIIEVRTEVR